MYKIKIKCKEQRMNKLFIKIIYLTLGVLLLQTFNQGSLVHANSVSKNNWLFKKRVKAGFAQIDITPPVGIRLAGYFKERISSGVHDPLWAKAIVLEQGKEKFTFVFCDLAGMDRAFTKPAREQISAKTGIPVSNIIIAATHTHTGPMFYGSTYEPTLKTLSDLSAKKFGEDPYLKNEYPQYLNNQIVKAAILANDNLKPIQLETTVAKQPEEVSFNRRFHMKNGTVVFNPGIFNPNIAGPVGPIDPDLGLLMFRDMKTKEWIGGLTVFALHLDVIGGIALSADYPYFLERTLKEHFGGNFFSAFGLGTCGDINHTNVKKEKPASTKQNSERIGKSLAQTVLNALPKLRKVKTPSFKMVSKTIIAPLQKITDEQLAYAKQAVDELYGPDDATQFLEKVIITKHSTLDEVSIPMEIQVFRIDAETAVVGLPGEIFVELGLAIKKDSPFKNTIVLSVCNDKPSYVPTKKAFTEGSYEITRSRVEAGTGEMMVETAIDLLKEVKN